MLPISSPGESTHRQALIKTSMTILNNFRCCLLCQTSAVLGILSKPLNGEVTSHPTNVIKYLAVLTDSCTYRNLVLATEWATAVSVPCNTWIFFIRIRALYSNSRVLISSFFILWCTTLISLGIPVMYKLRSISLGNDLCATSFEFHRYPVVIAVSLMTLFDTTIMVAISIRMMSYSLSDSWKSKMFCLIFGNEMGDTSRMFLKSSQVYYL